MNVSSLCSPGIASRMPSLIIMIFSPSHIFRDIRTGSAFCTIPIGSPPASRNSTPSRPRIKVGTAPSFIASSTPVPRSIQHRSIVAGFCSVPASKSTVFTNLSADRAENPVSSRRWVSSMTFSLSSLALLPLPMPSDRLIITCPGSPVCTVHVSPEIGSPSLGLHAMPYTIRYLPSSTKRKVAALRVIRLLLSFATLQWLPAIARPRSSATSRAVMHRPLTLRSVRNASFC